MFMYLVNTSLQLVKWAAIAVGLLNICSWPFVWTIRVFLPVLKYLVEDWAFRLSLLFYSRERATKLKAARTTRLSRVGKNPLDSMTKYRTWAGPDDCDYNWHMSNSVYPKILDMARMKAVLEHFPGYLRTGGILVLAGTHFDFIREIPVLSRYEARLQLYLVARFVTCPRSSSANSRNALVTHEELSEADGAIVHCVSINVFVFKHGRMTVPPALAMALEGYSGLNSQGTPYSAANQPPHLECVKKIKGNGGFGVLRRYIKSWKEMPEEERWWDGVFTGAVEEQRVANLALIHGVLTGMQNARSIVKRRESKL
uniref:Thioesterase/thiol ester dehydrase-isomerase n=1 Tax=Mycena chlorophos TaxID=658473 RepID=A0ABQ0KUC1_MYCCL|nr:predicted protein [Mycena chlorophos]